MEVNTHYSKTNLSKLIAAAERGEEHHRAGGEANGQVGGLDCGCETASQIDARRWSGQDLDGGRLRFSRHRERSLAAV
jgi:hypothetical protein